jgi:hypothetical protein
MEQSYRIIRVVKDGQKVTVATLDDLNKATELISSLNRQWPGDYRILPSGADSQTETSSGVPVVHSSRRSIRPLPVYAFIFRVR